MVVARLDDWRWLTSPEAEPFLRSAAAASDPLVAAAALRKTLSAARTALCVEQTTLRKRARTKFSHAERLFFTAQGLEQATDDVTAAYKAERFPADGRYADLCCGIGGDLTALARRGTTRGIDRDAPTAVVAEANCRVLAALCGPTFRGAAVAAEIGEADVRDVDAWHVDPDRRPAGRRTTHLEFHEPNRATLDRLLQINPDAAIKLAPASEPPAEWRAQAEWEWIGRRGECKQLVAWFGSLATAVGMRRATVVADDGTPRTIVGAGGEPLPASESIGRWVFEPDAAVLAADLTGRLAAEHGLSAVHAGSVYLTGDSSLDDAALTPFEVLDVLPFDVRQVRAWVAARNVGRVEIKKRGVDVDVERLRRELKLRGDEAAALILARCGDRVRALLCRRVARLAASLPGARHKCRG